MNVMFLLVIPNFINIAICMTVHVFPSSVDSNDTNKEELPYNVFLSIKCVYSGALENHFICGASILQQHITLTAAHCTDGCTCNSRIMISVGHEMAGDGAVSTAHSFLNHGNYYPPMLSNDIALVRVRTPFKFSPKVSRVALLPDPPYMEEAVVAGWGVTGDTNDNYPDSVQISKQYVRTDDDCRELLNTAKVGTFCANDHEDRVARGDAGSPLVVRGYIQIGLVSYKLKKTDESNKNVAIYTDIGHFYKWIETATIRIICSNVTML